jgi:hypothetical protein
MVGYVRCGFDIRSSPSSTLLLLSVDTFKFFQICGWSLGYWRLLANVWNVSLADGPFVDHKPHIESYDRSVDVRHLASSLMVFCNRLSVSLAGAWRNLRPSVTSSVHGNVFVRFLLGCRISTVGDITH